MKNFLTLKFFPLFLIAMMCQATFSSVSLLPSNVQSCWQKGSCADVPGSVGPDFRVSATNGQLSKIEGMDNRFFCSSSAEHFFENGKIFYASAWNQKDLSQRSETIPSQIDILNKAIMSKYSNFIKKDSLAISFDSYLHQEPLFFELLQPPQLRFIF